jgi:hypothetical protein
MSLRVALLGAACVAAATAASSVHAQSSAAEWLENCLRRSGANREVHCEVRQLPAPAAGRLDVDPGRNGGISVHGADVQTVAVEARIRAEGQTAAEARARAQALGFSTAGGVVRVHDSGGPGSASVVFAITTPRQTNLTARAQNGPVAVDGIEGTIDVSVVNGPLSLRNLGGDVRARTVNGPLAVSLNGTTWRGRGMEATAENGPVSLSIPEGYSAELTAGTVNGPLAGNFDMVSTGDRQRQRMIQTRLGDGGPPVHVSTRNGPAVINVGERRPSRR